MASLDHASSLNHASAPELSLLRSIKDGGLIITEEDVKNMNAHLIPSMPEDYQPILANLVNFGWSSLVRGSRWFFLRDAQNNITAAILNDLRDAYTRLFCQPDQVEEIIEAGIDPKAEHIFWGCCPEFLKEPICMAMAKRNMETPIGFEPYSAMVLFDTEKFFTAVKNRPLKLDAPFAGDELQWNTDGVYIDRSWTYHNQTSHIVILESIYARPSTAVRDTSLTPESVLEGGFKPTNQLAGWILCRSDYSLGSLKVEEPFRMKGLGRWLSTTQTQKIIEVKPHPFIAQNAFYKSPKALAFIDSSNDASINLHKSLGFDMQDKMYYWGRFYKVQSATPQDATIY